MRYVLQRHFIVNVDETKYLHLFYAFSPVPGFPFPPDILTGNFWDFFNLPTASSPRSIHRCCNANRRDKEYFTLLLLVIPLSYQFSLR